jgi:hypothetical protein
MRGSNPHEVALGGFERRCVLQNCFPGPPNCFIEGDTKITRKMERLLGFDHPV